MSGVTLPQPLSPSPQPPNEPELETREEELISPIPRLRSVHSKAGYRDALSLTKEAHLQHGFDSGFPIGAAFGARVGFVLGVLEGLIGGTGPGLERSRLEALRSRALEELEVERVLERRDILGEEADNAARDETSTDSKHDGARIQDKWATTVLEEGLKAGLDAQWMRLATAAGPRFTQPMDGEDSTADDTRPATADQCGI